MPDSDTPEPEVTLQVTGEDGETKEVTEAQMEEMLNDAITVTQVTVSVSEKRQLRQFEPNDYHLSFQTNISGVQGVLDTVGADHVKPAKKLFLSLLMAKMAGQVASMKRFIHAEMIKDGFDANSIDWRKGEKAKVLGE